MRLHVNDRLRAGLLLACAACSRDTPRPDPARAEPPPRTVAEPDAPPAPRGPRLLEAPTTLEPIRLSLGRPLAPDARCEALLAPSASVHVRAHPSGDVDIEHAPLEPSTSYALSLDCGGDHATLSFDIAPEARAVSWGPTASRLPPTQEVWVRFGAPVDRASVEASFVLLPQAPGAISFTDDRTMLFRPRALEVGRLYEVAVAGQTADGQPIEPRAFSFRTAVPPPLTITPGEGAPIALTFDDGSRTEEQATRLLDMLRDLSVKAILFPTGAWVARHPKPAARALEEGHRICNHTATHASLPELAEGQIRAEIVGGAGHGVCDLFRPPGMAYGKRVDEVVRALGYRLFLWDVDTRDWEGFTPEDIENRVLGRARPHGVVLFHMHSEATLSALPRIVKKLKGAGYALTYEGLSPSERVTEAPP